MTPPRLSPRRCVRMQRLARALLPVVALVLLGACDRTPQLMQEREDAAAGGAVDSVAAYMTLAQRAWEAGAGEEAARLTAVALRGELARRGPEHWVSRSEALLDSLNIGAEVRGAPCVVIVNLFARSNPQGVSWPQAFWCDGEAVGQQAIEGQGMRLIQVATRDAAVAPGTHALAVLYGQHVSAGIQPVLMTWSGGSSGWTIDQTLGADSLGGMGQGRFEDVNGTIDLVTETHRVSRGFQECPQCPHVERVLRFRWEPAGFARVSESIKATPYSAFVRFIQSLRASDYVEAMSFVSDRPVLERAINFGWARSRQPWRLAPGMHDEASEMVFLHGQRDAYRVWFEPRGDRWVISSLDTTARSLEVE